MIRYVLFALLASAVTATADQPPPDPKMDPAVEALKQQAAKPGDDALTCEQLETEIVASANAPEVQSVIQEQSAWAQEQTGKINEAKAQAEATKPASAAAQSQASAAEAMKTQAELAARMQQVMAIKPQVMRAAHLTDLAKAKKCDFMAPDAETVPK